ncbi:Arabinose 5-phosphate isomerase KdsD [Hartmannibacter diazotrophicus]|uniref:Arabinose 5-phosphate isomerase KdsD n=1 Tax=Hartmannibacter diazotrophicus TaxID=1482074 RepID=A0A2C9D1I7_9HYPH|nr:KpsF/GutQ family sugar-phosphate isomerase [Hartmannibacter diazotrophicus]SON54094.1 Arabinose 5-phosphate isomerase KdsD [Hartmannibacter diazotrophicus]
MPSSPVPQSNPSKESTTGRSVLKTLSLAGEAIAATSGALENGLLGQAMERAVTLIAASTGRLIVVGIGKSGHIARKLAATFASTGTPAYFVHPTEASHGDLGMIRNEDVILALSWSGETAELANILTYAKRFSVPVIAMTSRPDSTLAKAATVPLILPQIEEACPHGLAPTTSTMLQLVIGDALAICMLEQKGFSARDFKVFHPGGRLGAQLSFVRDLMHKGERLPLAKVGAPMSEAIMTMTSNGFGVVGVVDEAGDFVGIVTDGDLRRHMSGNLMEQPIEAVMTHSPKVIDRDAIATEALEIMQRAKISVLFVLDGRKPIGILHMLDLLRAGLA